MAAVIVNGELDRRPSVVRIFDAVCRSGPIVRSDLRRVAGASPSTISAAVADLRELGLVEERGRGESTGGRQPTFLDLGDAAGGVLAVDIGGHGIRAAAADLRGRQVGRADGRTPPGGDASKLKRAVDGLLDAAAAGLEGPVRCVAVSVAGIVAPDDGAVSEAINLPGWRGIDVSAWLARFGAPVLVENEANMAVLGEHHDGAAQGHDDVLLVAMGAGVGAGLIIAGRLHRGFRGAAGELGLMRTGDLTLEQRASATALAARHREATGEALSAEAIFAKAAEGAQPAAGLVRDTLDSLADGIAHAVTVVDPELVVLGGGYARAGAWLRDALSERLAARLAPPPPLALSALGSDAALAGAVRLAVVEARDATARALERTAALA